MEENIEKLIQEIKESGKEKGWAYNTEVESITEALQRFLHVIEMEKLFDGEY